MATTLNYFPAVKPSAIALGTIFTHTASLAVLAPVFGDTYRRSRTADSKEELLRSREAASAAALWGSSLTGAAIQTYAIAALMNATGPLSYKGGACLGTLVLMAGSAPSIFTQIFQEKRSGDTIAVSVLARVFETVGLSIFLTWWGTATSPLDY